MAAIPRASELRVPTETIHRTNGHRYGNGDGVTAREEPEPAAATSVHSSRAAEASSRRATGRKALLCTLGPSSMNREVISQLASVGVTSFRINMSHTDLSQLEKDIDTIRESCDVPICIDTEGSQIRTGVMQAGVHVQEGARVRLVPDAVKGNGSVIPLTPGDAITRLAPSARMSIDFDSVVLRLDQVDEQGAEATVLIGGEIGTRKAVTALPSPVLPAFSEKDLEAIRIGVLNGVRQYALSFCEQPASVSQLREMAGPESTVLAKIESRKGVRSLARIAQAADGLIIDRGDLSREVRFEAIPFLQKAIIRRANALGVPVYVATNLLESMVTRRTPTRAEVNDVMNTLLDGADGLVLAAETAIGRYPVGAAKMIVALMHEYEESMEGFRVEELLGDHPLALDRAPTTPVPEAEAPEPSAAHRHRPASGARARRRSDHPHAD